MITQFLFFRDGLSGETLPEDSSTTMPSSFTSFNFPSFRLPSSSMISTGRPVFFVLPERFERLIQPGGRNFQLKNHRFVF